MIALVITIIVLIIIGGISVGLILKDDGIINKAETAKKDMEKETAIETMNFKITNAQIDSYGKNKRLPNLQELADEFSKDDDFEYIELSSQVASLNPISIGESESIYTKLKKYPYEFEINSSLQLASVDGAKINTAIAKAMLTVTISNISGGTFTINVNNVEAHNYGTLYYYVNDTLVYSGSESTFKVTELNGKQIEDNQTYEVKVLAEPFTIKVCTAEGDNVNSWLACIGNSNEKKYTIDNLDELIADTTLVDDLFNSNESISYLLKSNEILFPYICQNHPSLLFKNNTFNSISNDINIVDQICKNPKLFEFFCNNSESMSKMCENQNWRNSMYNNYTVTESIIAKSTTAMNAMKASTRYATTATPATNSSAKTHTVYNGKAFIFTAAAYCNQSYSIYLTIGDFINGNSKITKRGIGGQTLTAQLNKFATKVTGIRYNGYDDRPITITYFKI